MPGKILIVEDDEELARVIKMSLERKGYAVQNAGDGLDALEKVKQEIPDLILLDLMLPKMNGCSVNMKLKENPQTAKIPVIVMTGYSHAKEFSEIRKDVTLAAYLQKPIPLKEISDRIERALKPTERVETEKKGDHPGKILIIDDDEDFRGFITFMFTDIGYAVDAAENGKQAKEYLSQKVPDIILLDIMMPDINGIELCRWIRSQPLTRDVPIIQMSALSNEAIVQDSAEMGAMDYVTKPVKTEILVEKVSLAMTRARRRTEKG